MINELLEAIKDSIQSAEMYKEDMNEISWNYQIGILISCNDAKEILSQLTAKDQTIENLKGALKGLMDEIPKPELDNFRNLTAAYEKAQQLISSIKQKP